MISGYICLVGVYHQYGQLQPSLYQTITFIGMGLHAYWNPPYFARQALEANVVDIVNRFGMHGSTDRKKQMKLDRVRLLSGLTTETAKKRGISLSPKKHGKGEEKKDGKPKKN